MEYALSILRCTESGSRLHLAPRELMAPLNDAIALGKISNRLGQTVAETFDEALVNETQTIVYPIIDGIPQMLIDEAIPLDQLTTEGDADDV